MTRESFPEIPYAALRSHAQPERVERVWRRLALDLEDAPRRSRAPLWWIPAGAAIFGLGVVVGARTFAPAAGELAAIAEPRPSLPAPGAAAPPERQAVVEARPDEPAPKHARPPRTVASGHASVEPYPDSYGEPVAVVSEPPAATGPAAWEMLAESGDFRAADEALERGGGFDAAMARAGASQLLVLADIARAAGARERATSALRRVLSAYDSAPEAPLAAWTLGNLLDQAGDKAGAAEAFAQYRRLSPTGDFAEDAAARQVDAALSQGNLELSARALDEYAQNFPKGRRLAELRKRFAQLTAPAPVDGAVAAPEAEEEDEQLESPAESPSAAPSTPR